MKTIEERAKEYSLRDFDGYYTGREKAMEEGYITGATEQQAIDEEVRLKKSDDMTNAEYDREMAFAGWYLQNGKGTPTYSDAIEWARKQTIDEVCNWFKNYMTFGTGETVNNLMALLRKALEGQAMKVFIVVNDYSNMEEHCGEYRDCFLNITKNSYGGDIIKQIINELTKE